MGSRTQPVPSMSAWADGSASTANTASGAASIVVDAVICSASMAAETERVPPNSSALHGCWARAAGPAGRRLGLPAVGRVMDPGGPWGTLVGRRGVHAVRRCTVSMVDQRRPRTRAARRALVAQAWRHRPRTLPGRPRRRPGMARWLADRPRSSRGADRVDGGPLVESLHHNNLWCRLTRRSVGARHRGRQRKPHGVDLPTLYPRSDDRGTRPCCAHRAGCRTWRRTCSCCSRAPHLDRRTTPTQPRSSRSSASTNATSWASRCARTPLAGGASPRSVPAVRRIDVARAAMDDAREAVRYVVIGQPGAARGWAPAGRGRAGPGRRPR